MTVCPACGRVSTTCYRCEHCGHDLVDVENVDNDDDDNDDDPDAAPPLVTDGGRTPDRESPTSRERIERDEIRQQGGVGDQYVGRCEDCRGDPLPCLNCFLDVGDRNE